MNPERFPPEVLVQDLRNAVAALVAAYDEHDGAWAVEDLVRFRSRVSAVNAELAAIRGEQDALQPRPIGATGWPLEDGVDDAVERITITMQRLTATWGLDRELPAATVASGGIGDHTAPVLENDDRTALVKSLTMLDRMLRAIGRAEYQTGDVPLLEELDAGEPLSGDLAMPAEGDRPTSDDPDAP